MIAVIVVVVVSAVFFVFRFQKQNTWSLLNSHRALRFLKTLFGCEINGECHDYIDIIGIIYWAHQVDKSRSMAAKHIYSSLTHYK